MQGNQMRPSVHEEPLTEAEKLRIIFTMIASPVEEGGAGITPGLNPWQNVESIFPLRNSKFTSVSTLYKNGSYNRNGYTSGPQNG